MKIKKKLNCTTLTLSSLVAAPFAGAAVISLPDVIRPAGGNVIETVDFASNIVNETVYLVGTVTWAPDASGGNVTVRYNIDRTTDPLLRARIGFGSDGGGTLSLKSGNANVDPDGAGPATTQPTIGDVVNTTPGATTSHTFVMKVIQTQGTPGGDWWFGDTVTPGAQDGAGHFLWVNPNLTASEASQPTPHAGWRSGNNNYKSLSYLTNGNTGEIRFTDFALYTGGDTPFDAIPEPSSAALLALGGLALIRRRRK